MNDNAPIAEPTRAERTRHAVMRVVVEAVLITIAAPAAVIHAWRTKHRG